MELITIREFLKRFFSEGSQPTPRTIQRKIQNCEIPAQKVGKKGQYFIDIKKYKEIIEEDAQKMKATHTMSENYKTKAKGKSEKSDDKNK